MVRGNWQRRVERTEARRTAAKAQKEHRRAKQRSNSSANEQISDYKASYKRLEEWLLGKGDGIGLLYDDEDSVAKEKCNNEDSSVSTLTVDIWTDTRPDTRLEYLPPSLEDDIDTNFDDDDEDGAAGGRYKGKKKEKGHRGGFKKHKGKSHPNAKNKDTDNNQTAKILHSVGGRDRSGSVSQQQKSAKKDDNGLCAQEFYFGKDKCTKGSQHQYYKQQQRHNKGRRGGRSGSIGNEDDNTDCQQGCKFQHYYELPKIKKRSQELCQPMTLGQVLNEKYLPHHINIQQQYEIDNNGDADNIDHMKPVLITLPAKSRDASLKASYNASIYNDVEDDGDSSYVDMMYHSRLSVENNKPKSSSKIEAAKTDDDSGSKSQSDNDELADEQDHDDSITDDDEHEKKQPRQKSSILYQSLQQLLDKEKVAPTSIVYLTIQGILIYDRNRGGLVFSDKEEHFLLYGKTIELTAEEEMRLDEDTTDAQGDEDQPMHIHEQLTHHLLDEILSYCNDECVAVLPKVCKMWHQEVGTRSPQLWKMLLYRHGWPSFYNNSSIPVDDLDTVEECKQCKDTFVSHYTVVRDVRGLVNACNYLTGGGSGSSASSNNNRVGSDLALQLFKATKGAPALERSHLSQCMIRVWEETEYDENTSTIRALAAYKDCTLRLFEVVRGGGSDSSNSGIMVRQIVNLRPTPPSISQKKDSCGVASIDLDDDSAACLVVESIERDDADPDGGSNPWLTVISRDDVVCAGNEGMLEDECIHSHNLRAVIIDYIMGGSDDDDAYEELQEALHNHIPNAGNTSDGVHILVTPKIVACGKGIFLFHAFICIEDEFDDAHAAQGHRLFLFSSRFGTIIDSIRLERYREGTALFASRPFKRQPIVAQKYSSPVLCTNVMISGPTHDLRFMCVNIRRDGTAHIAELIMVDNEELAPWSKVFASLTSTHAAYITDPLSGPVLHIQRIPSSLDEVMDNRPYQPIEIADQDWLVLNIFIIREQYVAVVMGKRSEANEDGFDGQWFGLDDSLSEIAVYHISSGQELYRNPLPSDPLAVDCIGDTLAMNVSNFGFVITGENAREVARVEPEVETTTTSPSGKHPKGKKKRPWMKRDKKKDGFARGMSMRG